MSDSDYSEMNRIFLLSFPEVGNRLVIHRPVEILLLFSTAFFLITNFANFHESFSASTQTASFSQFVQIRVIRDPNSPLHSLRTSFVVHLSSFPEVGNRLVIHRPVETLLLFSTAFF